jgi:peroxiredoxin
MMKRPREFLLFLTFFLLFLFLAGETPPVRAQYFEAGVEKLDVPVDAPDFVLEKLEGGRVSLQDLRGKVVLLNFFTPWCPVCRKEASAFRKVVEEMKGQGIVFLLVATESNGKEVAEFKKEFHISIPILLDEDGRVAKAYGVFGHHECYFINREGKIVGKGFGEKDWTSPPMKELLRLLVAPG